MRFKPKNNNENLQGISKLTNKNADLIEKEKQRHGHTKIKEAMPQEIDLHHDSSDKESPIIESVQSEPESKLDLQKKMLDKTSEPIEKGDDFGKANIDSSSNDYMTNPDTDSISQAMQHSEKDENKSTKRQNQLVDVNGAMTTRLRKRQKSLRE